MIDKTEIEQKAKLFEILPAHVERDYVFGWLIYGIFTKSNLKDDIFLKGGNALRKGYFENTRYSNDLDFGIPHDISQDTLLEEVNLVCKEIQAESGIEFNISRNKVEEKFPPGSNKPIPNLQVYEVDVYFKDFSGIQKNSLLKSQWTLLATTKQFMNQCP